MNTPNNTSVQSAASLELKDSENVDVNQSDDRAQQNEHAVSPQTDINPITQEPVKVVRREKVSTPQSFIDFVRHYGTIETIVFLDSNHGKAFSILNYAAKRIVSDEDQDGFNDDVNYEVAPPAKFNCNWQLAYELALTPEWLQLETLTTTSFPERDGILKLLKLRDYFVEPDDEFNEDLSYQETELRTFLPRVLNVNAAPATDQEMVQLMLDQDRQKEALLINFALPVHAGCVSLEALVLAETSGGSISFKLLNREQIMIASAKSGISKIRTNLGDTFPVFDTDLNEFDK